jgi:hypothetical protein
MINFRIEGIVYWLLFAGPQFDASSITSGGIDHIGLSYCLAYVGFG